MVNSKFPIIFTIVQFKDDVKSQTNQNLKNERKRKPISQVQLNDKNTQTDVSITLYLLNWEFFFPFSFVRLWRRSLNLIQLIFYCLEYSLLMFLLMTETAVINCSCLFKAFVSQCLNYIVYTFFSFTTLLFYHFESWNRIFFSPLTILSNNENKSQSSWNLVITFQVDITALFTFILFSFVLWIFFSWTPSYIKEARS